MELGIHVGYAGGGMSVSEQLDVTKMADKLGYDSVWTAEAYGGDAATPLAWFAGQTEKIKLGAAIFQMPGRTPANCAMTAASLDMISDGRFILGLGSSGPQVAEGWHGQPFAHQLQRTREYFEIVRKALARERLEYDGEIYQLPLPDGLGKPLKLIVSPVQEKLPIYLAAIGPKNTELCGEIADGWLPYLFSPEHIAQLKVPLQTGADRAGRSIDDVAICPTVFTVIDDDLEAARNVVRPLMALYIGGMGARSKNFYNKMACSYGFEKEAKQIQDYYLERKYAEAMAAIPDKLIDMTAMIGTRDMVKDKLEALRDAGVDTLIVTPMHPTEAGRRTILETLTELA